MKKSKFKIEIIEEKSVRKADDALIRKLLSECFTNNSGFCFETRQWHSVPQYVLLNRKNRAIAGHVAIVLREVSCGRKKFKVAGIQSLAVGKKSRGTGLSQALMTESMAEAWRRGMEFGLLFCIPELERFYASLGWKRIDGPVVMRDESGAKKNIPPKNIAMILLLSARPFPAGTVDLNGQDW